MNQKMASLQKYIGKFLLIEMVYGQYYCRFYHQFNWDRHIFFRPSLAFLQRSKIENERTEKDCNRQGFYFSRWHLPSWSVIIKITTASARLSTQIRPYNHRETWRRKFPIIRTCLFRAERCLGLWRYPLFFHCCGFAGTRISYSGICHARKKPWR